MALFNIDEPKLTRPLVCHIEWVLKQKASQPESHLDTLIINRLAKLVSPFLSLAIGKEKALEPGSHAPEKKCIPIVLDAKLGCGYEAKKVSDYWTLERNSKRLAESEPFFEDAKTR